MRPTRRWRGRWLRAWVLETTGDATIVVPTLPRHCREQVAEAVAVFAAEVRSPRDAALEFGTGLAAGLAGVCRINMRLRLEPVGIGEAPARQ